MCTIKPWFYRVDGLNRRVGKVSPVYSISRSKIKSKLTVCLFGIGKGVDRSQKGHSGLHDRITRPVEKGPVRVVGHRRLDIEEKCHLGSPFILSVYTSPVVELDLRVSTQGMRIQQCQKRPIDVPTLFGKGQMVQQERPTSLSPTTYLLIIQTTSSPYHTDTFPVLPHPSSSETEPQDLFPVHNGITGERVCRVSGNVSR